MATANFGDKVNVKGWVKAFRQKRFIQLNDGSTINNVQAVIDFENTDEALLKRISTGAAISIIDEEEAKKTFELLKQLDELHELEDNESD